MRRGVCWCLLSLALFWSRVEAHHSITGAYDLSREMTIEGSVTKFEFVNPHPLVTIAVGPQRQSWRLELDNLSELVQIGMGNRTFKAGDHVVVTGSPGRSQSQTLYVRLLDRPSDGLRYEQIGYTPHIKFGGKPERGGTGGQ
jgi:hypothetical protein